MRKIKIGDILFYSKKEVKRRMKMYSDLLPKLPRKKKKKVMSDYYKSLKEIRYQVVNIEKHK